MSRAILATAPAWSGLDPATPAALLAFRPFLDPLDVEHLWPLLLVPICLGVAVVFKALKAHDLRRVPIESLWLAVQVFAFMTLAALAVWLVGEML